MDADGKLNVDKLMTAFQAFFRGHAEHWVERFDYREAGPQLRIRHFCNESSTPADVSSGNTALAGSGRTC